MLILQPCTVDNWEPHLSLFEFLEIHHIPEDELLGSVLNFASQDELIEEPVHLVKVENNVQLAYIREELIHQLDEEVDRLHCKQLVVRDVNSEDKIQACISTINDLNIPIL